MKRLLAKELKDKFVEKLKEVDNFIYEDSNPFYMQIGTKSFYVFLKNLSPAYFKNSPDITRVQLPYSPHFSKILKQNIPFIILGYDMAYDIFVCWDPILVKSRLNSKSNVSLYSRNSLQSDVRIKSFRVGYLSNGDKILLFAGNYLDVFFENFQGYFNEDKTTFKKIKTKKSHEPAIAYDGGFLNDITEKELLEQIHPLLLGNKVLDAVQVAINFYDGKYAKMTFKDWFKVVRKIK